MVIAGADTTHADILLSGPDVLAYHCMLCAIEGCIYLLPYPEALVLVNGDIVHPPPPVISMTFPDTSLSTTKSSSSSSNSNGINNNTDDDKRHHNKTNNNRASNSSSSSSQESYVYDNTLASKDGDIIKYGRILTHNDRIAFGRFHFFRFEDRDRDRGDTGVTTATTATYNSSDNNSDMSRINSSSNNNGGSSKVGIELKRGWDYAQEEMLSKNSALMTSQNGHNYDLSPRNRTGISNTHVKSSRIHHHIPSTPTSSVAGAPPQSQSTRQSNEVTPVSNTYKQQQPTAKPSYTSITTTEMRKGSDGSNDRIRKASSDKNGFVNKEQHINSNNNSQDNTYTAYSSKPILSSLTIPPYHPPPSSQPPPTQPTPLIPPPPLSDAHTNQRESHSPIPESATPEAQFIFEKEAKELQIELTLMQQTLADRMAKYQILTKES